jgi:putative cell wall-binding protein
MEAGVTTATRRLRRAGVAGFATIATVGGLVLATGGTALAAPVGSSSAASGTAPVLNPGTTANAVADLTVGIPNLRSVGDTVTVQLGAPGFNCATTGATVGFSGTPTVTVTGPFSASLGSTAGTNTADVKPTFTFATASTAGACTVAGIKDQLVITLTNSGPAGDFYTLTVAGQKIDVGSKITPGNITETVNALPAVTVASVVNTKLTVSKLVATTPTATNVAIGDITAADVSAMHITGAITYTLANAVWNTATAPTMTGPAGLTWTFTGQGTSALVATPAGTAPTTASTYVLSKATIDPAGAGGITVTASYSGGTIGAADVAVGGAATSKWTGGVDRYATAAQLFSSKFAGAPSAVLASGTNFPDALSASSLAARLGTGVLLTDPNTLVQPTSQAVITNGVITVYIVGGTAAVSQGVENQLKAMHVNNAPLSPLVNVVRISGADRYATSNAINLFADSNTGPTVTGGTAVVATGVNFADALAIGPAVWDQTFLMVLTDSSSLSASAQSTLVNLGVSNVLIVGGTSAVSANVESQIKALGITVSYRIQGADRTQTAAQIAKWETGGVGALPATSAYGALDGLGWGVGTVNIARGDAFPDALAAGPVEGSNNQVILLTGSASQLGAGIPAFLSGKATSTINALGLTGAVNASTMQAAVASLAG